MGFLINGMQKEKQRIKYNLILKKISTMYRLIENIKSEAKSNRWANKKGAQFQYNVENNQYRLIELTPDLETYIIGLFS